MSLHSRRLGWETPLHFDHSTYTETHYGQVSPLPGNCCAVPLDSPLHNEAL